MKSFSFSARQSAFVEGLHSPRITRLTKASELSKSRTTGRLYVIDPVSMTGILSGLGCVLAPDGVGFGVGLINRSVAYLAMNTSPARSFAKQLPRRCQLKFR